jgi:hypothetical protein
MRSWFIGLILTLCAACALAQSPMGGITGSSVRTYTQQQTQGSGCAGSYTPLHFLGWAAQSFTASSSYGATRIDIGLQIGAGSPIAAPVTLSLYSDSGNNVGTLLQAASPTESYSLTGSTVNYSWFFSGQSLTNATRYWVVFNGTVDASNYPLWCGDASAGESYRNSSDGSTWNSATTGHLITVIYSSP